MRLDSAAVRFDGTPTADGFGGASDAPRTLERGDEGTVRYYRWSHAWDDDGAPQGTLAVDWDCGSRLSLVEGLDSWVLL